MNTCVVLFTCRAAGVRLTDISLWLVWRVTAAGSNVTVVACIWCVIDAERCSNMMMISAKWHAEGCVYCNCMYNWWCCSQTVDCCRCCFHCLVSLTVFNKPSLASQKLSAMLSGMSLYCWFYVKVINLNTWTKFLAVCRILHSWLRVDEIFSLNVNKTDDVVVTWLFAQIWKSVHCAVFGYLVSTHRNRAHIFSHLKKILRKKANSENFLGNIFREIFKNALTLT